MPTLQELEAAIAQIDAFTRGEGAAFPQDAWTLVRGEVRRRRRQSERSLPAVASAAQHFERARHALEEGIDELEKVPSPPPED